MMGRMLWLVVLVFAALLVAAPLAAQADAPLYLAIEGELMRVTASGAALEPVAACALQPGERIFGAPIISPDGRLIAFFTTRKSNEGPGLYIMRIDGGRPKRVSTLLGDSLRWDALPAGAIDSKGVEPTR